MRANKSTHLYLLIHLQQQGTFCWKQKRQERVRGRGWAGGRYFIMLQRWYRIPFANHVWKVKGPSHITGANYSHEKTGCLNIKSAKVLWTGRKSEMWWDLVKREPLPQWGPKGGLGVYLVSASHRLPGEHLILASSSIRLSLSETIDHWVGPTL